MRMKIKTNPDKEKVKEVRDKLKANEGYCPCRLIKSPENKCMCKEFLEQKSGYCHCGLYYKEEEI